MQVIVKPGMIQGTVQAVPSKSMMQRACAAALLHKGKTIIHNPGISDDDRAALNVIQQLGAIVTQSADTIEVESKGVLPVSDHVFCGESGLSTRLFTPIAALSDKPIRIDGGGSLLKRPMNELGHILPELGVQVADFTGNIPFTVMGPLQVRDIKIDGSVSSQYLSGLLFAFCYATKQPVTIEVAQLRSRPYIDMTLQVLKQFGRPIRNDNYVSFYIDPAQFTDEEEVTVTIEGDWSSAVSLLVSGAINGDVTVKGLNTDSVQADKAILDVLRLAGAEPETGDNKVRVVKSALKEFEYDAKDCPDIFPAISVLAAFCEGESYISGLHRLWHKESNRAESTAEMLLQFDVFFSIEDDMLCITGDEKVWGCYIDSYNDHRIVMAAAVAALRADSRVIIDNADAVNKSYPAFFEDLAALGVTYDFKEE